ncbi:hypothetical protein [Sphingomicrobium aestuariivivum]|nr:hypothetical protein [Sphingomicrobium aestuariivivum]
MTIAKRAAAAKFDPPEEEKPTAKTTERAPAAQVVREKMPRMTD